MRDIIKLQRAVALSAKEGRLGRQRLPLCAVSPQVAPLVTDAHRVCNLTSIIELAGQFTPTIDRILGKRGDEQRTRHGLGFLIGDVGAVWIGGANLLVRFCPPPLGTGRGREPHGSRMVFFIGADWISIPIVSP